MITYRFHRRNYYSVFLRVFVSTQLYKFVQNIKKSSTDLNLGQVVHILIFYHILSQILRFVYVMFASVYVKGVV